MDELKWGLIGSLEKGKAFLAELVYASLPHKLVSLLTIKDTLETLPGVTSFTNIHQFLQSDMDAVYIASPYAMHFAQVRQCLLHQKAVLCEKPIAQTPEQFVHLVQLAEENRTFMMEALWIRFLPTVKKILSVVSSGAIGEISSVKASLNYQFDDFGAGTSGGSALYELGVYPVFLCTLLLGKPEYIEAKGRLGETGEDETFSAFLSYHNGQYGALETHKEENRDAYVVIQGDKGTIRIKNPWSKRHEGIQVIGNDGSKTVHKNQWKGEGLHFELDEVYENWEKGNIESQLYSHLFNLDVMETITHIHEQLQHSH